MIFTIALLCMYGILTWRLEVKECFLLGNRFFFDPVVVYGLKYAVYGRDQLLLKIIFLIDVEAFIVGICFQLR